MIKMKRISWTLLLIFTIILSLGKYFCRFIIGLGFYLEFDPWYYATVGRKISRVRFLEPNPAFLWQTLLRTYKSFRALRPTFNITRTVFASFAYLVFTYVRLLKILLGPHIQFFIWLPFHYYHFSIILSVFLVNRSTFHHVLHAWS